MRLPFALPALASAFLLAAVGPAPGGEPPSSPLDLGAPIAHWLLAGPFPNPRDEGAEPSAIAAPSAFGVDHLAAAGGEAAPDFAGSVPWTHADAVDGRLDFASLFPGAGEALAYAAAVIDAPSTGRFALAVEGASNTRAWLNGIEILEAPAVSTYLQGPHTALASLQEGPNLLLVKVGRGPRSWSLEARIEAWDADRAVARDAFRVVMDGPEARLEAMGPWAGLGIESAVVEVRRAGALDPVSSTPWPGGQGMAVALPDTPEFERFHLAIRKSIAGADAEAVEHHAISRGAPRRHTLFDGGRTPYRIMVAQGHSPSERWIADRLAEWLGEISGARFAVVTDPAEMEGPTILVGWTRHTAGLLAEAGIESPPGPDADGDAFAWASAGPHLVFVGGRQRGAMYAVYDFLERELGCRWWTADAWTLPRRASYSFDRLLRHDAPAFPIRVVDYWGVYDPLLGTALRMNGQRFHRSDQPGGLKRLWLEHSFELFVPPSEHFDANPEFFSLRDGERLRDRSQLCLSNPQVLDLLTERLRAFLLANPGDYCYLVAQNDNQAYCQCPDCEAIAEREGGQSGLMLWFVNQVAERIEPDFPQIVLGTFAYQYTRHAPATIRPRENLLVTLCSIECDFSHPFDHPHNASFVRDLEDWTAMTSQVIIWDYIVGYAHYWLPHPNFRAMAENFRILADARVEGVMAQAQYQSAGGEFAEMRAWVAARLLWDPTLDPDALVREFAAGYYGPAAAEIVEYYLLLHDSVRPETRATIWNRPDNPFFTESFIARADAIFDAAEARAGGGEHLRRVERARIPILYLKAMRDPAKAEREGDLERLRAILADHGIERLGEGTLVPRFEEHIRRRLEEAGG